MNGAQNAVKVMLEAVEGTEGTPPAEREDLARWLDVLLETSPVAADLLGAAFVRLEQRRARTLKGGMTGRAGPPTCLFRCQAGSGCKQSICPEHRPIGLEKDRPSEVPIV